MRRSYSICFILFFVYYFSKAQTFSPVVVASTGGYYKDANINISWTVGEPVITTLTTSTADLTEGFHQPRVKCNNVDSTLTVTGSKVCQGTNGVVTIHQSTRGYNYQAYRDNNRTDTIGKKSIGNSTDLPLIMPDARLAFGNNTIYLSVSKAGCIPNVMPNTALVEKVNSIGMMPPISYTGTLICNPVKVYLFAEPDLSSYQWILNDTLIYGANLSLYRAFVPGGYEVMGFTPSGCLSASAPLTLTKQNFASPNAPQIATPAKILCNNSSLTLAMTNSAPSFTYQWRRNTVKIGGAKGDSYKAVLSGYYFVQVLDNNGCSNISDSIKVDFSATAIRPDILQTKDTLLECSSTNAGYRYQWYASLDNDVVKRAIVNANAIEYKPIYNATYYVSVAHDSCSLMSAPHQIGYNSFVSLSRMGFFMTDSSIYIPDHLSKIQVLVSPNPVQDVLSVKYVSDNAGGLQIELYDLLSKKIISRSVEKQSESILVNLDVKDISEGLYMLAIKNGSNTNFQKVVIE